MNKGANNTNTKTMDFLQSPNSFNEGNAPVRSARIELDIPKTVVKVDSNPIARYAHATSVFADPINKIEDVNLIQIYCPVWISWTYDHLIYFYLLMTLTCQSETGDCFVSFFMFLLYLLVLLAPYICIVTLVITSLFFIYYIVGIVVYKINERRLGTFKFIENMVHSSRAPQFSGQNKFFKGNQRQVSQNLKSSREQFMAYKDCWLDENYYYIRSLTMITIHIVFILAAVFGVYFSTLIFPTLY